MQDSSARSQGDRRFLGAVRQSLVSVPDDCALTVARVDDESFDVSLIPETLERTTLGSSAPGTVVNLEVDMVAKYVEKLVVR